MSLTNDFDWDLTERLKSRHAPALQRFDPTPITGPIEVVPPQGIQGRTGIDRSAIGEGSELTDLFVDGEHSTKVPFKVPGMSTQLYTAARMCTGDYLVDRANAASSMRGEDKYMKQGKAAQRACGRGLMRIASALHNTTNIPAGRRAAIAALSGGDGKNITDPECDVVRNALAARNLAASGNDGQRPNRMIMPWEDAVLIVQINVVIRSDFRSQIDAGFNEEGLRRILATQLGMEVVFIDAPSGASGVNIWAAKWAFVHVPEGTPMDWHYYESRRKQRKLEGLDAEDALPIFPGGALTLHDGSDMEFGEMRSSALILVEFSENDIAAAVDGNPQNFAVYRQKIRLDETVCIYVVVAGVNVDTSSEYLVTATNG
jgi:hypothetical protein